MLKNRDFGIGFGGAQKQNCRLWIDRDIFGSSYVNYRDSTYFDGCLLRSLDKKLSEAYKKPNDTINESMEASGEKQNESIENIKSFNGSGRKSSKGTTEDHKIPFQDFPIEIAGLEAWAIMTPDMYEKFNEKLAKLSTFNHYDKMIGINYGEGTKGSEVLIENSDFFPEKE